MELFDTTHIYIITWGMWIAGVLIGIQIGKWMYEPKKKENTVRKQN
jgi:hypothetical protein